MLLIHVSPFLVHLTSFSFSFSFCVHSYSKKVEAYSDALFVNEKMRAVFRCCFLHVVVVVFSFFVVMVSLE